MSHQHHDHRGDKGMDRNGRRSDADATLRASDSFSQETAGLPAATTPETASLRDGDVFDLRVYPVRKRIGDAEVRMLSYNGSIPGPTLRVDQGSKITVHVQNEGDVETTVH